MPMPVSQTRITTCVGLDDCASTAIDKRPPRGVNLGCVAEQAAQHLRQPRRVAVDERRIRRQVDGQRLVQVVAQGANGLHRVLHDRADVQPLATKLDPTATDAADVEQVIHQLHQVADLAIQRLHDGISGAAVRRMISIEFRIGASGPRSFVRQHRQEFVLAAVGLGQRFLDLLALGDVERGPRCDPGIPRRR